MVYKQRNGCKPKKKFQLMFLGLKGQRRLRLNISENKLSATDYVKLLGIEFDNKLKSSNHVKTLCSKVNKKISAFSRLNMYISGEQALTICNAVILSNFNYVRNLQKLMTSIYKSMHHLNPSLIWEFHEKKDVSYNLRIQNLCKLPQIKTHGYGQESLSFRGSILWNTLMIASKMRKNFWLSKRGSKTGLVIMHL